jgi:AbrB family looped-hinge helix DNA binding protein
MDELAVYRVTVGPKGRVVIPAALRRHLGINEGDIVAIALTEEGDSLELITPEAALQSVHAMFADKVPAGMDLVEELFEDRGREFELELREMEEFERESDDGRRIGT